MKLKSIYDLIICGGGHAGCEAANAAAKTKINVLLITSNLDTLSQMNCNPSVGGQAKGHLVCEVDALGGLMGMQANLAGIHFKLLNSSKGEAVQSPRIQCDKASYSTGIKNTLGSNPKIHLLQASVEEILTYRGEVRGVRLGLGFKVYCKAVVITTGTYINGNVFVGKSGFSTRYNQFGGGLVSSFSNLGISTKTFKTGTPPRILGSTINFNKCYKQESDRLPTYFGYSKSSEKFVQKVRDCWITNTNSDTHSLVYDNIYNSNSYSKDNYAGPRYCPSIEDKVIRFGGSSKHKVFLEPEGYLTNEWYVSGVSSSLPLRMQYKFLKSIKGLEDVFITKPGYSIQYDYIPSTNILKSLECKNVKGLFLAGQVNGTTGYEEAASQGLVAGLNASLSVFNEKPITFNRAWSYIGVLIDDIAKKEILEPYRVFTYRADNRLVLNYESACFRMLSVSKKYGLISKALVRDLNSKNRLVQNWTSYFMKRKVLLKEDCAFKNTSFEKLSLFLKKNVVYRLKYSSYLRKNSLGLNNEIKNVFIKNNMKRELRDSLILKV